MPKYSQAGRPLRVTTALGADELLLTSFQGTESISRPFSFQLEMMSENIAIDANAILRQGACVAIALRDGSERHIHGVISRFAQLGIQEDLAFYRAELVPWLWFLSLSRDCRIFQNLTVLEIIEQVFQDHGYSDYQLKCTRSYPKREYCVQYRESNLNFVSRLMEEEGIFYFHEHTDSKHTLILADGNSSITAFAGNAEARVSPHTRLEHDVITTVERESSVYVGKVTLRDFDPLQPSLTLKSTMSGAGLEEIYDYQPVIYTELDQGDRYARLQLEAEEALQQLIRGEGNCRFFQSGCSFQLKEHYRSDMNIEYALLEVEHDATAGDYRSWESAPVDYRVRFSAIPSSVVYRPQRRAVKPSVHGSQTAVVVGKSGEEIWTDKHGRVKVQFHWDREGKNNEHSSCWVRVSSAWAGKAWGAVHIPRMGQEVIVDFLEGDPDRPIITGRVYNAEQTPPWTLPANQTQSGIKSRSSKSGGTDNFNEIRMEDKKGSELLYIHAEKDKQVMVENDRTEEVGHDEKITVKHDRTEQVDGNETITIKGDRKEDVKGKESIVVTGKRQREVKNSETIKISTKRSTKIGTDDTLKVGTKLMIKAGTEITLKVGGNSIKIDNSGITIKGIQVKVKGTAKAETSAPIVKVKGTGMLQAQAPMSQIKGDGLLMLKGGIAMIN